MFRKIFLSALLFLSISVFATQTSYIMDTDMGFDDWLAVLYLLKQPVKIDAITIDCAGETYCPIGAINAEKLDYLANHAVPIASGVPLHKNSYAFPTAIREFASQMKVPKFTALKTDHTISTLPAGMLIYKAVLNAAAHHQQVVIISIGTAENIAAAWMLAEQHHQTHLFRKGLKMIVKGGGAFGVVQHQHLTNKAIDGNIPIKTLYVSHNTVAEWNIYADAPAMKTLIDANLPITFVPNNASNEIPMTLPRYNILASNKHNPAAIFSAQALSSLMTINGIWHDNPNMVFWDTAATFAALYPNFTIVKFTHVPVTLCLKAGDTYGGIFVNSASSHKVTIDDSVSPSRFDQKLKTFAIMG